MQYGNAYCDIKGINQMKKFRSVLVELAWCALFASPFFAVGISGYFYVFSPVFILLGAIILAFPMAGFLAHPAGLIYHKFGKTKGPQAVYSIPRARRKFEQYEESVEEYEKIVQQFPDEVEAWIEMLEVVVEDLKDMDRAERIYHTGIWNLSSVEMKPVLTKAFQAMQQKYSELHDI